MKFGYYPGCSLHGSSKEYDISTQAVCKALGIHLQELDDWICCGASSGHSLNELLKIALPAKNLKIAAETGKDLLVPCAACYNRLKTAQYEIKNNKKIRDEIKRILDYDGSRDDTAVLNMVEFLRDRIGLDNLKTKIKTPLKGFKAACYYGCLLVRPKDVTRFGHPEHPQSMELVMQTLGAESVRWSYKSECCGGSLSLVHGEIVQKLVESIIESAKEAGADAIVTLCPLCFENLDMRQTAKKFPIFYLTELLGLALGIKEFREWIKKHFYDPTALLDSLGLSS